MLQAWVSVCRAPSISPRVAEGLIVVGLSGIALMMALADHHNLSCWNGHPMLFLGLISYSLYLWHLPILYWTMTFLNHLAVSGDRLWWLIAIGAPAGLLAATISYYFVKRPFTMR